MAETGRRVGRKTAEQGKDCRVNFRVSDAEYAAIQDAAEKAEMTVSGFFRSLSLEGAGVRPVFNDEDRTILSILHEDMRKIGVNLNQVARSLNAGRVVDPEEIKIALRNVERITDATRQELRHASVRAGNSRRGEA